MRNVCAKLAAVGLAALLSSPLMAGAAKTTYPVVFAHGMGGFDDILGYSYWGDDYGVFVGDPCDEFLEVTCNGDISSSQKAYQAQVLPFADSEVRGLDLANDTEGFMAATGATRVNLIGHSQGGIDARKAAKVLYQRKGVTVVRVLISVSSPHRGSPVAKWLMDNYSLASIVSVLANAYGNSVYQSGNDIYKSLKLLTFNDYSSTDGITTGLKHYNYNNPISSTYAYRYASVITAQYGASVNPALLMVKLLKNIDGDGYCTTVSQSPYGTIVPDCENDGAAGKGDGNATEQDDDGLVGINSQQMGHRLRWNDCFLCFDSFTTLTSPGYVGNINNPSSAAMTSMTGVVNQDHADVIGLPPDTFDEKEFYAAMIDYIAYFD